MPRLTTPKQTRYNDPYEQQLFQFGIDDTRLYLTRISNFLLRSIATDGVIKGLEIIDKQINNNIISFTLSPGLLIQDSTLIEVNEISVIDIDVSGLDACNGYLIIYTNYHYLDTVNASQLRLKIAYFDKYGQAMSPVNDPWDTSRNRMYLNLFKFTKDSITLTEVVKPDYFYIYGKKYFRRGRLNFIPAFRDPQTIPRYFTWNHKLNTDKIFVQLYMPDNTQVLFDDFVIIDNNTVKFSIDNLIPFQGYCKGFVCNPNDIYLFNIDKDEIYTDDIIRLEHNLNIIPTLVQVFAISDIKEEGYYRIYPKRIQFTSNNNIEINLSNYSVDLANKYKIMLIKENVIHKIDELTQDDFVSGSKLVSHNLNKIYVNIDSQDMQYITVQDPFFKLNTVDNFNLDLSKCYLQPQLYSFSLYTNIAFIFYIDDDYNFIRPYQCFVKIFADEDLNQDSDIVIDHRLSLKYPIVEVFDNVNNVIYPDVIESINEDNIRINFKSYRPITGNYKAVIYAYSQNVDYVFNDDLTIENEKYYYNLFLSSIGVPVIQVYDNTGLVIFPDEIIYDSLNFKVELSSYFPIYRNFYISITDGLLSQTVGFNESSLNITTHKFLFSHNLNTGFPIVRVYDNLKHQVIPDSIQIINNDQIEVDLSSFSPISGEYSITVLGGWVMNSDDLLTQKKIKVDNDSTLSANSDDYVPSQRAIKTYVDSLTMLVTKYVKEFTINDLIDEKIIIKHNMNNKMLIVQVYDNLNRQVLPDEVEMIDMNNVRVNLTSFKPITGVYKIIVLG